MSAEMDQCVPMHLLPVYDACELLYDSFYPPICCHFILCALDELHELVLMLHKNRRNAAFQETVPAHVFPQSLRTCSSSDAMYLALDGAVRHSSEFSRVLSIAILTCAVVPA